MGELGAVNLVGLALSCATSQPVFYQPHLRGGPFVLDCAEVIDKSSFFCAVGEAVNGPGGYYGKGLDSMHDCLSGGFGPTPPFRMDVEKLREPIRLSSFYKEAVSILETHGVTVVDERR